MRSFLILLIPTMIVLPCFAQPKTWSLHPQRSKLSFVAIHQKGTVSGYLDQFTAKVLAANADLSDATIEIDANVYSFNSSHSARDQQFMAAEFFDVARYPVLSYKSTSLSRINNNTYRFSGLLQLHGVTEFVPLIMTFKNSFYDTAHVLNRKTLQISADLDRLHFNIGKTYSPYLIAKKLQLIGDWELQLADR